MKQSYTLMLLLVFLLAASCKKDKVSPLNQLPAITQEGKNTFGCLVNGKPFIPRGSMWSGPLYECYYQFVEAEDKYVFQVAGFDKEDPSDIPRVYVRIHNVTLEVGKTYRIGNLDVLGQGHASCYLSQDDRRYSTNQEFSGELKINRLDEEQQIVSGTFWFDAVNEAGQKVEVREGRFDMQYTK